VIAAQKADGGYVITGGQFTNDAQVFADSCLAGVNYFFRRVASRNFLIFCIMSILTFCAVPPLGCEAVCASLGQFIYEP